MSARQHDNRDNPPSGPIPDEDEIEATEVPEATTPGPPAPLEAEPLPDDPKAFLAQLPSRRKAGPTTSAPKPTPTTESGGPG